MEEWVCVAVTNSSVTFNSWRRAARESRIEEGGQQLRRDDGHADVARLEHQGPDGQWSGCFRGRGAQLTATATDPEQGTLTYAWSQSEGPAVTLQDATQARVQFTAPEVSAATEFVFVVKVSSESGLSARTGSR
ncbi:hypothetical protein BHS04_02520 [Myxococcus xanthus]|nr:hypothetical protein BHS04_02520 [Myxococcus xanthus]